MNWGQHINFLNDKGISISGKELSRADAFEAIWLAVSSPVAKDNKILGVELGKLDANLFEPQVKNLAINSVSANNLKEIIVAFNQPVNKDKIGEFKIKGPHSIVYKLTPSIQEDGMSVVLNVEPALKDGKTYKLVVEKTEAIAEKAGKLEKTEVDFSVLDKERPVVEKVEFTGPKHVTITFSEPIKEKASSGFVFEVKEGSKSKLTGNTSKLTYGRAVTVPLFNNLKEDGKYTVVIKGFVDYNGMLNLPYESEEMVYNKDTSAPTMEVVSANQEYVIVKFSKPVNGLKASQFHHTLSKHSAIKLYDENDKDLKFPASVAKVVFFENGSGTGLGEGSVRFWVDNAEIKDLYGNKLAEFEEKLTIAADFERPEVVKVDVIAENLLGVQFSKAVKVPTGTTWAKQVSVTDKDGKNILKTAYLDTTKYLLVELTKKVPNSDVKISITNKVIDQTVNENKLVPYEETISVTDASSPEIKTVTYKAGEYDPQTEEPTGKGATVLYVEFNENVDNTALMASNYQISKDGKNYSKLTNEGWFHGTGTSTVAFYLTKRQSDVVATSGAMLFADGIKDVAGNSLKVKSISITGNVDTEKKLQIKNSWVTSADTIKVKFNQNISDFTLANIKFGATAFAGAEINGDHLILTLPEGKSFLKGGNSTGELESLAVTEITFAEKSVQGDFSAVDSSGLKITASNDVIPAKIDVATADDAAKGIKKGDKIVYVTHGDTNEKILNIQFTREIAPLDAADWTNAKELAQLAADLKITIGGEEVLFAEGHIIKAEVDKVVGTENTKRLLKIEIAEGFEGELKVNAEPNYTLTMASKSNLDINSNKILIKSEVAVVDESKVDFVDPKLSIKAGEGNNVAAKLVVKVSEKLYANDGSELNGEDEDVSAAFDKTGTVTITSATYNAKTGEITFVFAGAANGDVIKASAAPLKDKHGNLLTGDFFKYVDAVSKWVKE